MSRMPSGRRYLEGNFAPVTTELAAFDLPTLGKLPQSLGGRYCRTGPNPRPGADPDHYHWSAGAGMVHAVELARGRAVSYRNRWIEPQAMPRGHDSELMVPPGTGNAALLQHAGRLYATSEMALPLELSGSLDTLAASNFGGSMPAGTVSHAHQDRLTGDLHMLAYHFEAPYLCHHRIDPRGRLVETRALPMHRPAMVHDFALTAEFLVVFDLPVLFSEDALLDGQPVPYRWQPEAPARVGLVPRHADPEATEWFDLPPCWITHVIGARQVADQVEVDAVRQPARYHRDLRGEDEGPGQLLRCTLQRRRGVALVEILDAAAQDLPVQDPRLSAGEGRWLWTTAMAATPDGCHLPAGRCLYRHDLRAGTRDVIDLGERMAGEFSFVPAHSRADEGQGWLVGYAWDPQRDMSELLVLLADEPSAEPLASVSLPGRVPFGNHGEWLGQA